MASKTAKDVIEIQPIERQTVRIHVVGQSPLVMNAMSQKVMQELLIPAARKTQADKAKNLKHDPLAEYQGSCYILDDPDAPTLIAHMATAFKEAMRGAALDMSGASKAQMGRLTYVVGDMVPIYGVPQMFMRVVRQAGRDKTPDVRTRAILPKWAATFDVQFVTPNLKAPTIYNLLDAAGTIQGIGDGRPEKGKMSYGQFRLADKDDAEYQEITTAGGRLRQLTAIATPTFYDFETSELYNYFEDEAQRRGFARKPMTSIDALMEKELNNG